MDTEKWFGQEKSIGHEKAACTQKEHWAQNSDLVTKTWLGHKMSSGHKIVAWTQNEYWARKKVALKQSKFKTHKMFWTQKIIFENKKVV